MNSTQKNVCAINHSRARTYKYIAITSSFNHFLLSSTGKLFIDEAIPQGRVETTSNDHFKRSGKWI